ncbi:unnamed protein product, partial [Discosporangium mesarthrocarpum]
QVRLCDTCLRSARDGLVRSCRDLKGLVAYWQERKARHRRMGLVRSLILGALLHGQATKRVAVEQDQERISSTEMVLDWSLKRLGEVQQHLQNRPE